MEEKREQKSKLWNNRFLYGALSLVCFTVAVALILELVFRCIMTNTAGEVYWQNPFDRQEVFEDSAEYGQMIYYDVYSLARYLAVCSQMEENGRFDENKAVDIIRYAYRKESKIPDYLEDIHLEYRLGDLIEWGNIGVDFREPSRAELAEIRSLREPKAGEATAKIVSGKEPSETSAEETTEEVLQEEGNPEQESQEAVTEYTVETVDEEVLDDADRLQTVNQYEGFDEKFRLTEEAMPIGASSLYEVQLPEGVSYYEIAILLQEATYDLQDNYRWYCEASQKYTSDRNLKYVMRSPDGVAVHTNLEHPGNLEEQKKEFEANKSYLIYDYATNSIDFQHIGTNDGISLKGLFREFAYLFPDGGTVYMTIQDEVSEYWGDYNTMDGYAQASQNYYKNMRDAGQRGMWAVILFLLALFFFVLFSACQPQKKKEELRGFDRWYTGIAGCIALAVEFGLFFLSGVATSELLYDRNFRVGGYLHRREFYLFLVTMSVLMYLLLLFFWGSFIRRCKAHTLVSGGLVPSIWRGCKNKIQKIGALILSDRSFLVSQVLPYVIFALLNLFLVCALNGVGIVLCVVLNALVIGFLYRQNESRKRIIEGITRICDGELDYQIDTEKLVGGNKILAENINTIGNTIERAVKTSLKDEKLKADLITNVSHDIKTPLTSIINYVDLLKKENVPGEKAQEYIRVLDEKSQRLKQLILDLVEASKISSGNIEIEKTRLDMTELLQQAVGEYAEKLRSRELTVVTDFTGEKDEMIIFADSRHMWRVLDNLLGNICKYAMKGTRVYLNAEAQKETGRVVLAIKNISEKPLNIPVDELTQRFVRGDEARNTEGSGLGLSIAQTLTQALGGEFSIYLDGDLFKVTLSFPKSEV